MKPKLDPEESEMLDANAVSKRVNVTISTLSNWRKQGMGPTYLKFTPGKRGTVRYRLSDVIEWERSLVRHEPTVQQNVEAALDRL